MTNPIPPRYSQRDNVLLNGVPSTVLSWPPDNEDGKYAQFEQPGAQTGSYNRMMGILGTDKIEDYTGDRIRTSLEESALSAQAPADTIEEVPEEPIGVAEIASAPTLIVVNNPTDVDVSQPGDTVTLTITSPAEEVPAE